MGSDSDSPRVVFLGDGMVGIGFHRDDASGQVALVFDLLSSPAGVGAKLPEQPAAGDRRLFVLAVNSTAALDALLEMAGQARAELAAMEASRD